MRFMPNKSATVVLTALLVAAINCLALAAEKPASLRIVTQPGLIVLDSDTLEAAAGAPLLIEVEPGEHVLRYFPYHTAGEWVHRYLVYPFSAGSDGRRTIDLSNSAVFSFRTEPQAAELSYRGRYLGRTPGDFLLLTGVGDSVSISLPGYDQINVRLDEVHALGSLDIYHSLDPQIAGIGGVNAELQAYQYQSPLRKLLAPDLMTSFVTGAALLALGSYFNNKADDHYDRYKRLLGPTAREREYSAMKRNDKLSKTSFIVGDTALGVFGYLLVRRFILQRRGQENMGEEKLNNGLSMKVSTRSAQLSFRF
jgi:hypothetical protein